MCHQAHVKTSRQTDVVIIGSGCSGLWVSLSLTRRGIGNILLDTNPPGAFASTANQGWLQSGGWQLAGDDPLAASDCRDGYHFIRANYPNAIRSCISCYFLMSQREDLDNCLDRCQLAGIQAYPVAVKNLKVSEPILRESPLEYALQMPDVPVDTHQLLQAVAHETFEGGAQFLAVSSVASINPFWDGSRWCVELEEGQVVQARAIVLACGVVIPDLLQRCIPDVVTPFERTKIPVMVLHGSVARSLLITLHIPGSPNLVPFHGIDGDGVSICLSQADEKISDYSDATFSEYWLTRYEESFTGFYSGLVSMIRNIGDIPAHMYMCQKLRLAKASDSRSATCLSYAPESGQLENLFAFYPGKFTASPIASRACVAAVEACLGGSHRGFVDVAEPAEPPVIARQRYYKAPEYLLTVQDGKLALR